MTATMDSLEGDAFAVLPGAFLLLVLVLTLLGVIAHVAFA